MNMIQNHMEQIALSATAIAELPFPRPKIFTNSLLHPHDITALIRDTEAHERALFKVAPPEPGSFEPVTRRNTIYPSAEGFKGAGSYPGLKSNTAVGRILGGDFLERMRRNEREITREKTDVDVEVLLRGAEKLCNVYPVPGVMGRIADLRTRHEDVASSIADLEATIAQQNLQLSRMKGSWDDLGEPEEQEQPLAASQEIEHRRFSAEEFTKEEDEMKQLEEKRQGLQARVSGMDKDLEGLRER